MTQQSEFNTEDLGKLVEKMTMSGRIEFDQSDMKLLKSYCKNSQENVERVFRMIWNKISHKHCQVRLSALIIINELFIRSHLFRISLIDDLEQFFDYVLGLNKSCPLPSPKKYHGLLKEKAIGFIDSWNKKFGDGYTRLRAGFLYLKDKKLVNFQSRQVINEEQLKRIEQEKIKKQNKIKIEINNAIDKYQDLEKRLEDCLKQMEECFNLLMPKLTDEPSDIHNHQVDNDDDNEDDDDDQEVEIKSNNIEIVIQPFVKIVKNKNTVAIIDNLRDMYKETIIYGLAKIKRLMTSFTKDSSSCENYLKRAIDLKYKLDSMNEKYEEMKIIDKSSNSQINDENDSSDDDDEFIEVPIDEQELIIPDHLRHEFGLEPIPSTSKELNQQEQEESSTEKNLYIRCNVPLISGQLCPRRDKFTCPFHGKIIPRDESGVPLNEEDRKREEEIRAKKAADWQDPDLIKEIKITKGIDLSFKKAKRKSKYSELDDLKKEDNTARKRLAKKLKIKENKKR